MNVSNAYSNTIYSTTRPQPGIHRHSKVIAQSYCLAPSIQRSLGRGFTGPCVACPKPILQHGFSYAAGLLALVREHVLQTTIITVRFLGSWQAELLQPSTASIVA